MQTGEQYDTWIDEKHGGHPCWCGGYLALVFNEENDHIIGVYAHMHCTPKVHAWESTNGRGHGPT